MTFDSVHRSPIVDLITLILNYWYTLTQNCWYTQTQNYWYTHTQNCWYTQTQNFWYTLTQNYWYTLTENLGNQGKFQTWDEGTLLLCYCVTVLLCSEI